MDITSIKSNIKSKTESLTIAYRSLSPERVLVVWSLLIVSFLCLFAALLSINSRYMITVPTLGGKISEGIVGTPRFINPVLATTEQDKDLTALVFAGLTKRSTDGSVVLDMAQSITESDDKLQYDVVLKPNVYFHDSEKVTADDIIYTISLIQNPTIKSPYAVKWEGVTIEKKSDTEFTFSLKKPYPLFMNALTVGILPKHIWKNLNDDQISFSDYNRNAIGSGPFYIDNIANDNGGIPKTFTLKKFKDYTLGRPYINEIDIVTYQNEKYLIQGFKDGEVSRIHGISIDKALSLNVATTTIKTSLLPRTITIFFNPNKADFLSDKIVRQALNMSIDKNAILNNVLKGYGKVIDTPYPFDDDQPENIYDVEKAKHYFTQVNT